MAKAYKFTFITLFFGMEYDGGQKDVHKESDRNANGRFGYVP